MVAPPENFLDWPIYQTDSKRPKMSVTPRYPLHYRPVWLLDYLCNGWTWKMSDTVKMGSRANNQVQWTSIVVVRGDGPRQWSCIYSRFPWRCFFFVWSSCFAVICLATKAGFFFAIAIVLPRTAIDLCDTELIKIVSVPREINCLHSSSLYS